MSTIATGLVIGTPPPLRLAGGVGAPGYVAGKSQLRRLAERRRVRRLMRDIHEGKWRRVLIDLQVSQYAWPKLQRHGGQIAELLTKVNLVRLACKMHATVLVGTTPAVSVPEGFEAHRQMLLGLERACALDGLLHSVARKINVESEAALRVDLDAGQVVLALEDNDRCLPVGADGPDNQPTVWERRWIVERPNPANPRRPRMFLRVERHRAPEGRGVIEQEAYESESAEVLQDLSELKRVPLAAAVESPPAELVETGATRPLITRFVADYYDGEPQFAMQESDLDLVDTVAAAITRLARSHALHARPKVRVDEAMVDKRTGEVDLSADAIIDPDKRFEFIAADLKLTEMLEFMDRSVSLLLVMLQMSQALLGTKLAGGATPDSYDKLRLEATNTLSYSKATAVYFGPALERALTTASEVDSRRPLRGYAVGPVSVRMNVELPKDQVDLARELAEMKREALIDERTAIARLHGEDRADEILAAIESDRERETRRQQAALFGAVPAGSAGQDDGGAGADGAGGGAE